MATDRFKDASWLPIAQSHYITVGGAGGIGSCVAYLLSRIAPKAIYLYDDDTVSNVNLSNQLFGIKHIDSPKVNAVQSICADFSDYAITTIQEKFTEKSASSEIMISCFDNMAARKTMFEVFKQNLNKNKDENLEPIFIDGRLTAEQFYIYAVTEKDIERYEKTLFPDSEAAILPCGFKGTTHNSFMIASKMIAIYTNYCHNLAYEKDRTVPFSIENDIFTMTETLIF